MKVWDTVNKCYGAWKGLDGAGYTYAVARQAGERNPTSTSGADHQIVRQEGNATRADIGVTETLITAAPAHLIAIIPNDANSGYVALRDANVTGGGSTPIMLPNLGDAGLAMNGWGARFENGITAQGEAAACDVTIVWRPI